MSALHSIIPLPEGKKIADVLPAFAGIKGELRIGQPSQECACCRKPFSAARKPRRAFRLYPTDMAMLALVPVVVELRICGKCYALHQRGGTDRERFLAAIQAYYLGEDATQ